MGKKLINAHPETVIEQLSFRGAFKLRRCLVPAVRAHESLKLLQPYPAKGMSAHPVSTIVNNPPNDDPRCVEAWE